MRSLADFQDAFAAGLLAGEPPVQLEAVMRDPDWRDRFAVYRNNVVTALADAVVANHPTVERLVGVDFMRAAAAAFVRAHPPSRPDLTLAGRGFAAFLKLFPPARALPYLADVAALDRAWLEALFAQDVAALTSDALAALPADALGSFAPGLVGSARIRSSAHPAYSIWVSNRGADSRMPLQRSASGETALFWRVQPTASGSAVRHRLLSAGEAVFIRALKAGESLEQAGAEALAAHPKLDIAAVFAGLLAAGVLAGPKPLRRQHHQPT